MAYRDKGARGFSLVELLVVIGVIAVLIGILIPVVSKVRVNGYIADSKNLISQLQGAIERYHADFRAYPGPIRNELISNPASAANINIENVSGGTLTNAAQFTQSENLVLGLCGGLRAKSAGSTIAVFDPALVGSGPTSLNPSNPKRYSAYMETASLSTGAYSDEAGNANDTIVPEFIDRFPQPMPILYLRSKLGVSHITTGVTETNNSVITNDPNNANGRVGAYDLSQIIGYTGTNIGVGKELKSGDYKSATFPQHGLRTVKIDASLKKEDSKYTFPYDAFPYFQDPNQPNVARQKDGYILIAPGRDRTYGTSDDICSFGEVLP